MRSRLHLMSWITHMKWCLLAPILLSSGCVAPQPIPGVVRPEPGGQPLESLPGPMVGFGPSAGVRKTRPSDFRGSSPRRPPRADATRWLHPRTAFPYQPSSRVLMLIIRRGLTPDQTRSMSFHLTALRSEETKYTPDYLPNGRSAGQRQSLLRPALSGPVEMRPRLHRARCWSGIRHRRAGPHPREAVDLSHTWTPTSAHCMY